MKSGTCKFYNGDYHNKCCEAGVPYRSVTTEPDRIDGKAFRKPCVQWDKWRGENGHIGLHNDAARENWNKRGTCDKYTEPTKEEIADYEAEMKKATDRMLLALNVIAKVKKEHKGQSWKGIEECPACGGKLHMSHAAYNGHVWGKCETEGCLSWME